MFIRFSPFLLVLIAVLCACSETMLAPKTNLQIQREEAYLTHVVAEEGETVASVARRYTGSAANWKVIVDANPEVASYRLKVGDVLRIPAHLAVAEPPPVTEPLLPPPAEPAPGAVVPPIEPVPSPSLEAPAAPDEGAGAPPAVPSPPLSQITPASPQPSVTPAPDMNDERRRRLRNELLDEILRDE